MITPEDIQKKLLNHWSSTRFLKAEMADEPFFPLVVPFRKPAGKKLLEHFDLVRKWLQALKKSSRPEKGYGYDIEFTTINHRQLGLQQFPKRILIADRQNFLQLIGKEEAYNRFKSDLQLIAETIPQLLPLVRARPDRILKYSGCWSQLLAVCLYFSKNPRPDLYLRELDIAGVDSKFIEQHRKIISELLDQLLPDTAISSEITGLRHHGFERRYFLKYAEQLIRYRSLDPALCPSPGMTDISVPVSHFCTYPVSCQQVIITENKINGLIFPPCPGTVIIFGLGYGIQQLAPASWLHKKTIWYWGDIDTHGFAILASLRTIFPHIRSFLMDHATLTHNKHLWGHEQESERCLDDLPALTAEEETLYTDLRQNNLGVNIRLEQERIGFRDVLETVGVLR